jgi:hypothetical protein
MEIPCICIKDALEKIGKIVSSTHTDLETDRRRRSLNVAEAMFVLMYYAVVPFAMPAVFFT